MSLTAYEHLSRIGSFGELLMCFEYFPSRTDLRFASETLAHDPDLSVLGERKGRDP
jgi:hypothetical protein